MDSPISGVYTTEPQYSNMVREAIFLGYEVVAYDGRGRNRENESVGNIGKILESNDAAKMIIHCGWSHIYEHIDTASNRTWLGKKIQDSLGLNPLTVNQVILTERPSSMENPLYSTINFSEPTVFVDAENQFYNGFSDMKFFDILLYQPRTRYIHNRPHWLVDQKGHQLIEVSTDIIKEYPCLIKAYKIDDGTDAVPVDVIEKRTKFDPSYLILPTGQFRVEISNKNGLAESKMQIVE